MQENASFKHVALSFANVGFCVLLMIGISGDWLWIEGWIFGVWIMTVSLSTTLYLYRHDPGLLLERYKMPGRKSGQKPWDVFFVAGIVVAFILWIVIIPLDARRYHWTMAFPLWLKLLGAIFLMPSFVFLYRPFVDNTFLSPLVRAQTERKHRVITSGVYAFVRHPMYLGAVLMFFGGALLMASAYGTLVGIVITLMLAGRIVGEEHMMLQELEGYAEYKRKVKYRLVPFIW